ncbi:uncharacterized protein [Leuresthes tenuis]|uniref:uncharacterized protein n=1 Tax=Leuresthes tenuis TaxID=355514 RepID=UPI003B513994
MSRPRSGSPRYRRFPWEEPDFDPHKVLAELDGTPWDRRHRFREGPEELVDSFREDMYPEGQRRSSPFPDNHQYGRQHHPDKEEFYHRRLSPHHDGIRFENQRLTPLDDGGFDTERRRGGFREHFQKFESKETLSKSPLRIKREELLPTSRSHLDHQQRETGTSWWREEQGKGQGRFRDFSPRSGDQRAGDRERGKWTTQGPNRARQRENPHHERAPPFKRPRREMDDADHLGYREEENFGEKGFSPGGGFRGNSRGNFPRGHIRHSGPVVIEHDHGSVNSRELPRWEKFEDRRRHEPDFDRRGSPRSIRTSDSRLDDREDARDCHSQDNLGDADYCETARGHMLRDAPNAVRYGNRDDVMNHRGRGGPRRYSQGQGGRTGHPKKEPTKGYHGLPHEEQRPGYQSFREDFGDPIKEQPKWAEKDRVEWWEHGRPRSLDRRPQRNDLAPKFPHQKEHGWSDQKANNMAVVTEETLTIKVDMSRPVNQNSSLCYSTDRQLSFDLVNVGRQRLDFLPMLEHSGTYQETAMHTGTFAQEIITLVHLVKEQYFRGDGVTLNERFSAPQKAGVSEEEPEELTLNQRFSSNRGFSLNLDSLLDDEPLFARLGPIQGLSKQPLRGPGDLRHDLERRRQQKLEGVRVTIAGGSISQRPPGQVSESDRMSPVNHEGFWSGVQNRRRKGDIGPRIGASDRLNIGPQRRNNRFANRRHNMHNNPAGPNW